jgi:hypothetical protein
VPEPFSAIEIVLGVAVIVHGTGVGVGAGVGVGVGVGVGAGVAVGYGVGVALADGYGVGVALADGSGVGVAEDDGAAVGVADADGSGVGPSEITLPPEPLRSTAGIQESRNISESRVTSPEPVILTLLDRSTPATVFVNPTEVSIGVRPRQSNPTVRGILMVTPFSVVKFRVVCAPEPLKSMVTEYVVVLTC